MLATLICVVVVLYIAQRQILFPAPSMTPPADLGFDTELIRLPLGNAILMMPESLENPAPLIVFAHGNAEVAHLWIEEFRFFQRQGVAVLLLEYPGYAGSPGSPSAESILAASLDSLDTVLTRREIDESRVVLYGRSLGTGVVCAMSVQRPVSALILESPLVSLHQLVTEKSMPAFLLRDELDCQSPVASFEGPVFLYHGFRDQVIPHHHSDQLAELTTRATVVKRECSHNDCPRPWSEIYAFLSEIDGFYPMVSSTFR